jgi:hypothetical protein
MVVPFHWFFGLDAVTQMGYILKPTSSKGFPLGSFTNLKCSTFISECMELGIFSVAMQSPGHTQQPIILT